MENMDKYSTNYPLGGEIPAAVSFEMKTLHPKNPIFVHSN